MNIDEVLKFYNELVEYYGDELADFEHCPITFAHQIKLYKYYKVTT